MSFPENSIRRKKRAFTLIELLVVIAMIAILAAHAVARLGQGKIQAQGHHGSVNNINVNFANNSATLIAAKKSSGHVSGESVGNISVNAAYADGHVESHKKQFINAVYDGDAGSVWFY